MARPQKRLKMCPDVVYRRVLDRASSSRPREWALFFIIGHLGLRVGEAVLIRAADFHWDDKVAEVPTLKQRDGQRPRYLVHFDSEDGSVPRDMKRAVGIARGSRGEDARLFPRTTRWVQMAWHRYVDRMGWRDLGVHSLRHWFGVATYRATTNIVWTQRQLRHSSIHSTMVYADIVDAEELAKKFKGPA